MDHVSRNALPLGLLASAGFLSSAGARVIDPLLHVVATDFATTVPAVSVLISAYTLPYGLLQLPLGPLGDRFGKLKVILAALLAYAVATGACALATDLPTLTLLRAGAGAASAGLIPVCLAYIGDAVPYAERQVTLSRFLTGVVLAQTVAGPLGGLFGDTLGLARRVFVVLALGALLVAGALALRVRDLPDRRDGSSGLRLHVYVSLLRRGEARALLLAALFDGMLLVGCFPFLAPYLRERFGLAYAAIGLLLAGFGVGALAYTRAARPLLRHLGEARMMLVGGALMALALTLAVSVPLWPVFVLAEPLLGLGFFMLHGVLQARATELLPHARATAVSFFACLLFVGQSVGAVGMGSLIGALGYRGAFGIEAACTLLLGAGLAWRLRRPGG